MNKTARSLFTIQEMNILIPDICKSVSSQTNLVFNKPKHKSMKRSIFNVEQFTDMDAHKFTKNKDELLKKINFAKTILTKLF
jgi:hypothetical protein